MMRDSVEPSPVLDLAAFDKRWETGFSHFVFSGHPQVFSIMRTLIALFVLAVPAAQAQYAFRIGDGANDWGRGVIADAAGNTFVTGKFSFTADFDPGPGEA